MQEIGSWLRQEREARGLTREDLQATTKISMRYIEALEEGNFSILPEGAYERAFIRTYALGMGVDPGPIISRYCELHRGQLAGKSQEPSDVEPVASHRQAKGILATFNGTLEWLGL